MQRIDALGASREERFQVLSGALLEGTLDTTLQELVTAAARELSLPIALVTFVLRTTQFFRAYVGLPPDLALARATDRDASFCQFVVRDGARFEVTHASTDDRVPQELVERYGVEAYLGEPVRVDGRVVGSLCVMGPEPRTFSEADRASLLALAARVTERLDDLAHRARSTNRALVAQAVRPAFGELRNLLAVLTMNAHSARIGAADAAPVARLVRELPASVTAAMPALLSLTNAADAASSLGEVIVDIDDVSVRLVAMVEALDAVLGDSAAKTVPVQEVVAVASQLAHHRTKLVGGVSWAEISPSLQTTAPRMVAVSVVAAALAALGNALAPRPHGIRGRLSRGDGHVMVELRAEGVDGAALSACVAELARLVDEDPFVAVTQGADDALGIRLAARQTRG